MNRDNALFALMGLVIGFVAAYPVFEAMSRRQPALRPPVEPAGETAARASAPAAGGGPMNEEVRRLREYVEANPDDADAVRALADLNLQVGDLLRGRALYEQYVRLRPQDPEGLLTLANLHYEAREYARAKEGYERYLERVPDNVGVLTDLASVYRFLGEPERALELLRRAERLDGRYWIALYNQVLVLAFDFQDFSAADEILGRLRGLQPDNPRVEDLAAEVAKRRGAA